MGRGGAAGATRRDRSRRRGGHDRAARGRRWSATAVASSRSAVAGGTTGESRAAGPPQRTFLPLTVERTATTNWVDGPRRKLPGGTAGDPKQRGDLTTRRAIGTRSRRGAARRGARRRRTRATRSPRARARRRPSWPRGAAPRGPPRGRPRRLPRRTQTPRGRGAGPRRRARPGARRFPRTSRRRRGRGAPAGFSASALYPRPRRGGASTPPSRTIHVPAAAARRKSRFR